MRYGVISRLLNSFGIDMMGRDYLWSMANPYYEFSITYIGRGFEYVDTIIAQWYNDGLINQPYPFHNDILKVFVEVGFPGFLLWSSIQYSDSAVLAALCRPRDHVAVSVRARLYDGDLPDR